MESSQQGTRVYFLLEVTEHCWYTAAPVLDVPYLGVGLCSFGDRSGYAEGQRRHVACETP